jgi:hypothetical protein
MGNGSYVVNVEVCRQQAKQSADSINGPAWDELLHFREAVDCYDYDCCPKYFGFYEVNYFMLIDLMHDWTSRAYEGLGLYALSFPASVLPK